MTHDPPIVVLKFGGTSVASRARWDTIKQITQRHIDAGERPVLVCSAISQVTNTLERLLDATRTKEHEPVLEKLREVHRSRADELGVDRSLVEDGLEELTKIALGASLLGEVSPRVRARALAWGELLSTRLGAAFLTSQGLPATWVDAREHLVTIDDPDAPLERRVLNASCADTKDPAVRSAFEDVFGEGAQVIVTQGFLARDTDGRTVVLGRGGSDTSASYFAAKLAAARCEIWTDVPGMFTTNPRDVPTARLLRRLDYDEAQELATTGAKVLHPRSVLPCKHAGIPLSIHSTDKPELDGTVISATSEGAAPQVKAIARKGGVMLVSMDTLGMWQQVGFLADVFAVFKKHGVSVDQVSTSEANVTCALDVASVALDDTALDDLVRELNRQCATRLIGPCAAVSLVGRSIRAILHQLGPALRAFEEQNIHLVSQAASDLNLTFIVDEAEAERLVTRLHQLLFAGKGEGALLGPSWRELKEESPGEKAKTAPPWWRTHRDRLLDVARQGTPAYVYDQGTLDERLAQLGALQNVDRLFYAIKANAHPEVLRRIYAAGVGLECVSPGEVAHVRGLFPDIPGERLLYTPNFAPREDYEAAAKADLFLTVDNAHPLRSWPELFDGREILLRLDPGRGRGHHAHVRTAGAQSKFGIAPEEVPEVARLAKDAGARVVGLHAHSGSGIRLAESWSETAGFLAAQREHFPDVRFLDLGGGLGVPEKPGQLPLDLAQVDASLATVKAAHDDLELWIEPGRYYVAEAGVLLASVTQTKQKGDVRYVGTDCGMNSLIRPALYGAFHNIVNLTRAGEPLSERAHVVGPICETGDTLGHARRLAPCQERDVMLIATAGAYGRVMSSTYNLRDPAREVFLES
jgi:diaminopimelate decarboxylase/aspartate kinase